MWGRGPAQLPGHGYIMTIRKRGRGAWRMGKMSGGWGSHGVGDLRGSDQFCGLGLGRGSVPSAGNTEMNSSLGVWWGGRRKRQTSFQCSMPLQTKVAPTRHQCRMQREEVILSGSQESPPSVPFRSHQACGSFICLRNWVLPISTVGSESLPPQLSPAPAIRVS